MQRLKLGLGLRPRGVDRGQDHPRRSVLQRLERLPRQLVGSCGGVRQPRQAVDRDARVGGSEGTQAAREIGRRRRRSRRPHRPSSGRHPRPLGPRPACSPRQGSHRRARARSIAPRRPRHGTPRARSSNSLSSRRRVAVDEVGLASVERVAAIEQVPSNAERGDARQDEHREERHHQHRDDRPRPAGARPCGAARSSRPGDGFVGGLHVGRSRDPIRTGGCGPR